MADRYLTADDLLATAGLHWYEISNWAAGAGAQCRHNLLYWRSGNWWGIGPGAHSHVGGTRWWNVRHPSAYAARVSAGDSPAQAREILTERERRTERILLLTRLAAGCPLTELDQAGLDAARMAVADGLAEPEAHRAGRVVLTQRGRLLADAVVRDLTG
jgi:oxygen-independent coproporphyrinogen-3 oxidase